MFGAQKKGRKFKNEPVEIDGHKFPSHREGKRYCELKALEKAGVIFNLRLQVKFRLLPSQKGPDKKVVERPVDYIADFTYENYEGEMVVEDAKGHRTREYIIKRKLMLWVHGIIIKEV